MMGVVKADCLRDLYETFKSNPQTPFDLSHVFLQLTPDKLANMRSQFESSCPINSLP